MLLAEDFIAFSRELLRYSGIERAAKDVRFLKGYLETPEKIDQKSVFFLKIH